MPDRGLPQLGFWRILGTVLALGFVAMIASISVVSSREQDNSFCGSCHTQPETTFLGRFTSAANGPASDLAAFHHKNFYPRNSPGAQPVRCIDCHVGEGLLGRSTVLTLAAWDALKYVSGTARQPAQVVFTVQNEACIKCHEDQVKVGLANAKDRFFIDNHFHYMLFLPGAPAEQCVGCHVSHRAGAEATAFQFRDVIIPVCQDCHQKEGRGPVKMQ